MTRQAFLAIPLLAAVLAGCSQGPETSAKPAAQQPPEPVTGQAALWKLFQVARAWSGDIQVLKMNSILLSEVKQTPGTAAAWEATFVSPAKELQKSWTYSVLEAEGNLHEGVFAGSEGPWLGGTAEGAPFAIALVKTDTDAAYQTAKDEAGPSTAKNAATPINFLLESTEKFPNPVWRVIWGQSLGTSGLSVFVDATTGKYLQTMH